MKILMVGASGKVGGILRPAFESRHDCRYLDVVAPAGAADRGTIGSVADPEAVATAADGAEVIIQLAMARWRQDPAGRVNDSYDVHVKGMHRLLEAAVANQAKLVYASTLSVYHHWGGRPEIMPTHESMPADATEVYGLTKRLAEEVGRAFCASHPELSVVALRLVHPLTPEELATEGQRYREKGCYTAPDDLRRAFLAACERDLGPGLHLIHICTDPEERFCRLERAAALLDWRPTGE